MLVKARRNLITQGLHRHNLCCVTVISLGLFFLWNLTAFWRNFLPAFSSLMTVKRTFWSLLKVFSPLPFHLCWSSYDFPDLLLLPLALQAMLMGHLLRIAFAASQITSSGSPLESPPLHFSRFSWLIRSPCPELPSRTLMLFFFYFFSSKGQVNSGPYPTDFSGFATGTWISYCLSLRSTTSTKITAVLWALCLETAIKKQHFSALWYLSFTVVFVVSSIARTRSTAVKTKFEVP